MDDGLSLRPPVRGVGICGQVVVQKRIERIVGVEVCITPQKLPLSRMRRGVTQYAHKQKDGYRSSHQLPRFGLGRLAITQ